MIGELLGTIQSKQYLQYPKKHRLNTLTIPFKFHSFLHCFSILTSYINLVLLCNYPNVKDRSQFQPTLWYESNSLPNLMSFGATGSMRHGPSLLAFLICQVVFGSKYELITAEFFYLQQPYQMANFRNTFPLLTVFTEIHNRNKQWEHIQNGMRFQMKLLEFQILTVQSRRGRKKGNENISRIGHQYFDKKKKIKILLSISAFLSPT